MKTKNKEKIVNIIIGICIFISSFFYFGIEYLQKNYVVSYEMFIVTMFSDLHGTGSDVVLDAIKYIVPRWLLISIILIIFLFIFNNKKLKMNLYVALSKFNIKINIIFIIILFLLVSSFLIIYSSVDKLGMIDYYKRKNEITTIYEDYYVEPGISNIKSDGDEKNIIYIYLESMESTFMSKEHGGLSNYELIPNLRNLALEYDNFSFNDGVGGFHSCVGTRWTVSALLATQSGIPYSFPIGENGMNSDIEFAPNITTLGDILNKEGYIQEFLCGSDSRFGSRNAFFKTHGDYIVYDYYTALDNKKVNDYVWWGFDDNTLYDIAKEEITKLAKTGKKFNFTMLTVDTHPSEGYICDLCDDKYEIRYENVIDCADRQIYDFINWIKEQEFYENTLIVITGDHPSMQNLHSYDDNNSDRFVYNCFINSGKDNSNCKNRKFNSLDIFPTILSAMNFDIIGNKLGLGTNLYSNENTLEEEFGYDFINDELSKYSNYYAEHFY